MFKTQVKNVFAMVLVLAGIGAGLLRESQGAEDSQAKEQATDQERIIGNWAIVNEDSKRRGEMWVIYEDRILMYANYGGINAYLYFHRLDAEKDPKEIDITVTKVNGPSIGVIKGIYALAGDELRLCLGEMDKNRPAAFPEKPGPGEMLILHRAPRGAGKPQATEEQPAAKNEQKVLTSAEAIHQRPTESVTVEFKVGGVEAKVTPTGGFGTDSILLRNWGSFSVRLMEPTRGTILGLGIEPQSYFMNKVVRVTGVVEADSVSSSFQIQVKDLNQFLVMKGEPPKTASSAEHERIIGAWTIINGDSMRKGEPWIVSADSITDYANLTGFRVACRFHRLDPTKSPKEIDITVTKTNLEYVGLIKGIYELDSNAERLQWRLCLGEMGKDRPAAFPEKPEPGQVLILHHAPEPQVGEPAAAKAIEPPKANKEPEVLTPAEAIKQVDKEQVSVRFDVASVKMGWSTGLIPKNAKTTSVWWELSDGNNFSVVLRGHAAYQLERLRIDTINHFKGKAIQATGRVQERGPSFSMAVDELDQLEIVR